MENQKIKSTSKVNLTITIELTETEAQALLAMTGYGTKTFLEIFYKYLGKYYLKPFEPGVYSLFETLKSQITPHIQRVEKARRALKGANE